MLVSVKGQKNCVVNWIGHFELNARVVGSKNKLKKLKFREKFNSSFLQHKLMWIQSWKGMV